VAAKYLADDGVKVALFEKKLSVGGGMWAGGMLFPKIVVQQEAKEILDEFQIKSKESEGLFVANSIESVGKIASKAMDSGAKIFNGIAVEDVMIRKDRISGLVINWHPINALKLDVDPLAISSEYVIDATGHSADICRIVQEKVSDLNTLSGKIQGERSMWAEKSERMVVENTREVYPRLFVAGMAANAVFGAPRMGPIFGGMLLSGKKAAKLISERL
jgi:thiazole biosynthesis enzyme